MVMSKAGSEVILKCLMGREKEIDVEALPWGPESERAPAGIETVIPAVEIRPRRGKLVEEVIINRARPDHRALALPRTGEDGNAVIEIKEEPDE